MAAGVPVVASAVGGVPELVEDGRTGLLYPPGDDEGMAQAIERVIGTAELRERLSRNGRREVEARFRSELYVAGVEAVYEAMT
jgi:glycosyltransferase involved in cell wall biosynthesis